MKSRLSSFLSIVLTALCGVVPAQAQSPNTATMVVVVVDQTGGVVNDATVRVVNGATGATREVTSAASGSATIAALPLTGTYTISVAKTGFTAEDVTDLTLRAGETATVKIKLVASGGKAEVTVYGTTQGVRADAQIGRRLDSSAIDETPILGRKVTTLGSHDTSQVGGLQPLQSWELPGPRADDVRRHRHAERDVRSARERRYECERDSCVREHRSAADVPASGAVHVLAAVTSARLDAIGDR